MPALHFTNLLIVVAAGLVAPLALGFCPRLRIPAIVLEIVLGIVIGPSVLGWVKPDLPVAVLALVGLAFLLFLAGLEFDVERLRGRVLKLTAVGFAVSFAVAIVLGLGLRAGEFVKSPLFVAIVLVATSLGVIFPVLKDSGNLTSSFGQLVIAAASIAEFGSIVLLSLFFSGNGSTTTSGTLILLGVFIPIFFVTTGVQFDLNALFADASTVARVPLFLVAIYLARGLPALVYVRLLGRFRSVIAGVLQSTSLPFVVAAAQIGLGLGVVSRASAAALVAAGLLSVAISPTLALVLLRRGQPANAAPRDSPSPVMPVITAEDRALSHVEHVRSAT